ncbi:aminotransferase class V-fold PLP-dependent enzyme [Sphingomonas yabuuchiae]|uniref:Aminotransferase class V-fold PLP-dependent enzyme n=1 Tax=Sphingomonas yabuuchiae TaxID=172044 RepID=A0AA41DB50_9SPHN|nr:aminotransferase class V-fold PLP-dependent enzyme [Sphingomonas yabuuchiae]MBB4610743.1 selenocysteine lyase/cysteine desulfurase [Sphingomonas yabuuchiae]MBN3557231.1 aminotransferase class V-fold PLP-dependent enzyme [Sphingomonas yabuuchiae]
MIDRRMMLAGGMAAVVPLPGIAAPTRAHAPGPDDETFWAGVAADYDRPSDGIVQLENGNWGAMARPVRLAYEQAVARVNRDTSYYARRGMLADLRAAREAGANELGVPPEEIAFTRNATEALKALILGYNRLSPGDAVLYADLDYDSMQACMESLGPRRGVRVRRIALPEPATRQALIDAYAQAMAAEPRLKLILLTHLSHRTGLVLPVREIAAMARARGIDVVVDAAHSWQQLDFALSDLDCDFVGLNGHKWLGAPLGTGILHIRRPALARIDRDPAEDAGGPDSLLSRVHTGTLDYAAWLTAPAALAYQRRIDRAARAARLRALRDRWVARARQVPGITVLTPDDPALHGAITSFRIDGVTSAQGNAELAKRLLDRHRVFTVHRTGPAKGACIRVTPALFTSMAEVDRLAAALPDLVASFPPSPLAEGRG